MDVVLMFFEIFVINQVIMEIGKFFDINLKYMFCFCFFYFMVYDGFLNMCVFFRLNDIGEGFLMNFYGLVEFFCVVFMMFGYNIGYIVYFCFVLYIY